MKIITFSLSPYKSLKNINPIIIFRLSHRKVKEIHAKIIENNNKKITEKFPNIFASLDK
jgi:hypothetical protein